ncbi:MAG: transposase [Elusimicrobiota bacterium]
MPRISRFVINNGIYHILSRGHNRQVVFHENEDYQRYLMILADCKQNYSIKLYHYTLMPNHPHLILTLPEGKMLAKAMRKLNQSYAQYYRRKYGGIGYLWQDRFKSFVIQNGLYLLECGRYVETNPVRAELVESPEQYPWSSYRVYVFGERNPILDLNPEYLRLGETPEKRQIAYREFVLCRIIEKRSEKRFFNDGVYGNKEFAEQMKNFGLKPRWSHKGKPKKREL